MTLPRCPQTGKTCFPSEGAARAWMVEHPLTRRKVVLPDRIYRCPDCRSWHFTGSHHWTSDGIRERRNYGRRRNGRKSSRKRGSRS